MGMILRIASSRIVGQGDIVGRSGYFSLNLSANSVMRGRLDARRTLKSLVADLRDKTNIVANLTPKAKAVIRRDFLIENFKNAYGSNAIADMLLEFAGKHMPERLADIENGHNEVYEKRHQRIEEKKAVLLVQEQAKQEAEQTETDADNEKQPQSQEVAA